MRDALRASHASRIMLPALWKSKILYNGISWIIAYAITFLTLIGIWVWDLWNTAYSWNMHTMEKSDLKFHLTRETIPVTPSIPFCIFTWLWVKVTVSSLSPCSWSHSYSASGTSALSHLHSFSAQIPSAIKKTALPLATALSSFYCPDPKADSVFSASSFGSHAS